MAVLREDWLEWRDSVMTQLYLEAVGQAANQAAQELLQRPSRDGDRDLYLRGLLQGLSLASGWIPELVKEFEGERDPDSLKEEDR